MGKEGATDVDVIIPFHRVDQYLYLAINSTLKSERVNLRIIAVNDCGYDVKKQDLGLRNSDILIKSNAKGYVGALSTGVSVTTSPWIAFVDSDDLIDPQKLHRQVCAAEKNNSEVVTGRIVRIDSSGKALRAEPIIGEVPHKKSPPIQLLLGAHGADSTMLVKGDFCRANWHAHANYPAMFADYAWTLRQASRIKIIFEPEAVYYYRSHSMQMSRSAELISNWAPLHTLWCSLLSASVPQFESFGNELTPNVSLSLAFPSALVKLNRKEREVACGIIDVLKKSNFFSGSSQKLFVETLNRRGFLITRGINPRYIVAGINMLLRTSLIRNLLFGIFPRIGSKSD